MEKIMLKYGLFLLTILLLTLSNITNAVEPNASNETRLYDSVVGTQQNKGNESLFDSKYLHKANYACGFAPFPPFGCKVGACVCDQNGQNCQWTFICK
jgi:hypothetical protein